MTSVYIHTLYCHAKVVRKSQPAVDVSRCWMASFVAVKTEKRPAADSQDADSNAKKPRYAAVCPWQASADVWTWVFFHPRALRNISAFITQSVLALKETSAEPEDEAGPRACPGDWHGGKLCGGPAGPRFALMEGPDPGLTRCRQWLWPVRRGGESTIPEAHAGRQEPGACGPWPDSETVSGRPVFSFLFSFIRCNPQMI